MYVSRITDIHTSGHACISTCVSLCETIMYVRCCDPSRKMLRGPSSWCFNGSATGGLEILWRSSIQVLDGRCSDGWGRGLLIEKQQQHESTSGTQACIGHRMSQGCGWSHSRAVVLAIAVDFAAGASNSSAELNLAGVWRQKRLLFRVSLIFTNPRGLATTLRFSEGFVCMLARIPWVGLCPYL